jgi:hypothetical protein
MEYKYMYTVYKGRNFQRQVQRYVHSPSRNEITLKISESITYPKFRENIRPFFVSEVLNQVKSLVSEPNCTQNSSAKTTIFVRQAASVSTSIKIVRFVTISSIHDRYLPILKHLWNQIHSILNFKRYHFPPYSLYAFSYSPCYLVSCFTKHLNKISHPSSTFNSSCI